MEPLVREMAQWQEYTLLDSGDGEKCERFGKITVRRPDPEALWPKADPEGSWQKVHASFIHEGEEGFWRTHRDIPPTWQVVRDDMHFILHQASFKHVGLFPEQASNWDWLRSVVKPGMKVLNLFGYTGGATIAAALAEAEVAHVDASKPSIGWARENAEASGVTEKPIRWLVDDAPAFVAREIRREKQYDVIVLDPPAFGRGPNGELWQFERDLSPLLQDIDQILAPTGHLLLSAYALGFPAIAIEQVVRSCIRGVKSVQTVELLLQEETERKFVLPAGLAVRASRDLRLVSN